MTKSLSLFTFLLSTLSLSKGVYAQNVGIGTNTPAYKLDVKNGSINTDSLYRISSFPVLGIAGNGNLFVGRQAGIVNTGNFNTFAGDISGIANTSGSFNTFFGSHAGALNTTGPSNSFFGVNAGASNTNGFDNSFFGREAGSGVTNGSNNCFFGRNAGVLTTTGYNNIAIGKDALFKNIDGQSNVAIGDSALYNYVYNYTIVGNVAIGSKAGYTNINGTGNTYVGTLSGYSGTTAHFNTFLGSQTGFDNSTGLGNLFAGTVAGRQNTTGDENTFLGFRSGYDNTTGSRNTFVGTYASTYSNTSNNSTAIGYTSTVSGNIQFATAVGSYANVTCSNCLALGGDVSNYRTRVGINNAAPATDLHIIQQTDANGDNTRGIRLQRPSGNQWRVFLDPLNNYIFQYNNNVFAYIEPVNGSFISSSDVRLKKDISSMDQVLDKLLLLQPKTYHYIASSDANRYSWGFLAQDVEKLFPDFVFSSENGMKGIAYSNFSVIAVKAIQEQQQLINEQRQEIDQLKQQMELMLKRMESFDRLRTEKKN